MHGRVKVRTSEEEKARKEKERQEKLKVFKHVMQKVQSKRKLGELDEELFELTGKLLSSNPDIYTLWNIRREILNLFRKKIDNEEELAKLHDAELQLTEYCLKVNPKSYCAWHQRQWVQVTRPDPDWQKELQLCNTYLKLDERNFHTWDHRRFVVSHCKPPLEDEFNYTTEKLHDNFSNYSAWHYRSKMLVELHPDLEGGRPIQDNHHKHELKMVINAAFTDPDDTSAWFYQRWLLGAVKKTVDVVVCTLTPSITTVAFNQQVSQDYVKLQVRLIINGHNVEGEWKSCTNNSYDCLWIYKHQTLITDNLDVQVTYETETGEMKTISCSKQNDAKYVGKGDIDFQMKYSKPVIDELKSQLDSCRQLMDLEPDSKWTLLTTTFILHCLDATSHHKEVLTNLNALKTIDKFRAGYYNDLLTKWSIEEQLRADYVNNNVNCFKITFDDKITSLPHLQYYSFCDTVDLSGQNLSSKVLPSLVMLQHCKKLNLANNQITTLKGFPDLDLEELDLRGNEDIEEEETKSFREKYNFNILI